MFRNVRTFFVVFSLLTFTAHAYAQSLAYIGEGVRQNTTLYTFDSYKMVHYASSPERSLSPSIARSLQLTMLSDFGTFFTKDRMVEALEQSMIANSTNESLRSMSTDVSRFKKTLLALPIKLGSELRFNHNPGSGLQVLMNGPRGFMPVFQSADDMFSMTIMSIWLGVAHQSTNNRDNLVQLIEHLWTNAR